MGHGEIDEPNSITGQIAPVCNSVQIPETDSCEVTINFALKNKS